MANLTNVRLATAKETPKVPNFIKISIYAAADYTGNSDQIILLMPPASKKTKNKGEWSEAYALVNLAIQKELYACDRTLQFLGPANNYQIDHLILDAQSTPHNKIILTPDTNSIKVKHGGATVIIQDSELKEVSDIILDKIKGSSGTFEIPEVENFWIKLFNPKLKSKSGSKRDLTVAVKNNNGHTATYGFSVKSDLGNKPSLLNASQATNFLFKAPANFAPNPEPIEAKELGRAVKGLPLQLLGPSNAIYKGNIDAISSDLGSLLSEILLEYYGSLSGVSNLKDLLGLVQQRNPLNLQDINYYKVILVQFLEATALGMVPNKTWNKTFDADGGLIIVKKNGELAAFFRQDKKAHDELLEYLADNTLLETASKSRHKFGKLQADKSFKLNLQIRTKD